MESIPNEDTPTLLCLLITSKLLYHEAARCLYEEVSLLATGEKMAKVVTQQLSFFGTVCSNRNLAELVYDFEFDSDVGLENKGYWDQVAAALRALTKLHILEI